ncbi:MAG: glycosyltransferase family 1 protein [Sphingobacteriia bacterium]|nr:MAG: glycosyltransferase family 1 protein [Sphingobacteriia bacterium]
MKTQKKIVVGIDIRDLKIAKTGLKTYLEELCKEFAKPDPLFDFIFITNNSTIYTGARKWGKLFEHIRYQWWKQIVLPFKAKRSGCKIIFCTDFFVPYFSWGILTVPVFHDAFFWEYPHHYNKYWRTLFVQLGLRAAKKSACIITPTNYTQKRISFFSGISTQNIIPVHEGPKRLPNYASENRPIPQPYLLHIGTAEKRKNLPFLIEAFKELIDSNHPSVPVNLCLVLGGQFSNKSNLNDGSEILASIAAFQLKDRVILPGYILDGDLPAYYTHAAAYVFPSINEGFGIPILEAFHYGIPVLIANNSCLPEVAGDAALQFDPYNKTSLVSQLLQVLSNSELRETLISKGKVQLQFFRWESASHHLKKIFQHILSQKSDSLL